MNMHGTPISQRDTGETGATHDPKASGADLRTLARGSSLVLLGNVAGGICGFLVIVVVTHGFGAEGAGVFFQVIAVFSILAAIAQFGADTGLVRYISRYRALGTMDDLPTTLAVSVGPVLVVSGMLAVAAWWFAPDAAALLTRTSADAEQVAADLRMLLPFLPIATCATVLAAGSRGFGTMIPFVALEGFGKPALRLLLMVAVPLLGLGVGAFLVAWAAPAGIELVGAVVAMTLLYRRSSARTAGRATGPAVSIAAEFWKFALPRGMAGVFQIGLLWVDVLLVGALVGPKGAGIYAATSRLAMVGMYALDATRVAIAPQIAAHLAKDERREAQVLYRVGTWWLMAVSWPVYLTVALFAPLMLQLFGAQFVEGAQALMILAMGMLFALGVGNVTSVLLMGGASRWNLLNVGISLIVNVILNLLLIPRLGIEGAAIAWAAALVVDNTAALVEVRSFLRMDPFGDGYGRVAVSALVGIGIPGLIIRAVFGVSLASLGSFIIIAVPVYGVLLWRSRNTLRLRTLWESLLPRRWNGMPAMPSGD